MQSISCYDLRLLMYGVVYRRVSRCKKICNFFRIVSGFVRFFSSLDSTIALAYMAQKRAAWQSRRLLSADRLYGRGHVAAKVLEVGARRPLMFDMMTRSPRA